MSESSPAVQTVEIISSDNVRFVVDVDVASRSVLIRGIIEGNFLCILIMLTVY